MDFGLRRQWNRLGSWLARRTGPDDAAFVELMYGQLLGRPPDPPSRAQALEALAHGDLSRAAVRNLLLDSPERQAYETTRQLYQELLGRAPTADERWNGVAALQAGSAPADLRQALRDTTEYAMRQAPVAPAEEPYHVAQTPYEIWLELTTRCNMVPPCTMCGKSAVPAAGDDRDMPPEVWQRLLPVLTQARILGLHGGGEPLLYRHLFPLLGAIDPERTQVGFNTNGHLLTAETTRRLIEQQLAWLSVSIDAATPEMYLRLRRRTDWERLLDRIRRLVEVRAQLGSRRPRVELNMTLMRTNLPEAPRLVELAAALGVDSVLFQQIKPGGRWTVETPDGYHFDYAQEEISQCRELHDEMVAQARTRARELGLALGYEIAYQGDTECPPDESAPAVVVEAASAPPAGPPGALCAIPWSRALISVDGDVTFCCYHIPDVVLGNVRETPFADIWNGPRARTVRALLLGKTVPRCCQNCFMFYDGREAKG